MLLSRFRPRSARFLSRVVVHSPRWIRVLAQDGSYSDFGHLVPVSLILHLLSLPLLIHRI